jgi:hypothetical protein
MGQHDISRPVPGIAGAICLVEMIERAHGVDVGIAQVLGGHDACLLKSQAQATL